MVSIDTHIFHLRRRQGRLLWVPMILVASFLAAVLLGKAASGAPDEEVIFFDQFNVADTTNVPDWEDAVGPTGSCGVSEENNAVRNQQVRLQSECGIARLNISTQISGGLQNIVLSYLWGYQTDSADSPGELVVEWKLSSDGTWQVLQSHTIPGAPASGGATIPASIPLPPAADNTTIDIRFRTTTTGTVDAVWLDDIELKGELINPIVDSDFDDVPDDVDQCPGTGRDEKVNEVGCSVNDYIARLVQPTANAAISDGICTAGSFSLVVDASNSILPGQMSTVRSELRDFVDTYNSYATGWYEVTAFNNTASYVRFAGYEQASDAKVTINSIPNPVGQTATAAGIQLGTVKNPSAPTTDHIMFVVTDGSPNLPDGGYAATTPERWIHAANEAIAAANQARAQGFVVFAVFIPFVDGDLAAAFGGNDAGLTFARAVMERIGGGSYSDLGPGGFSGIAEELHRLGGCDEPPPPPPTRTIAIEVILAGDTPPAPVTSVQGTLTPHGPWQVSPVPGETTLNNVTTNQLTASQDPLGEGWTTEYGLVPLEQSCDMVEVWQVGPITVPAGETDYRVCVLNTYTAPPEPLTRTVIIEKLVDGDQPGQPLGSVSGTLAPYGPWSISPVPGSVTLEDVSTGTQILTETSPGDGWLVEYGLAPNAEQACAAQVINWVTGSLEIPAGEEDVRACVRNTFLAEPTVTKTALEYNVEAGEARWVITVTNTSQRMQQVVIRDVIAPHLVGELPPGCSGNLVDGLVCNVDAEQSVQINVRKVVQQQCRDLSVLNTATAAVVRDGIEIPIEAPDARDVAALVPGDPDLCEYVIVSKSGSPTSTPSQADWTIFVDNRDQDVPAVVTIQDAGAVAIGDVPNCDLRDGDSLDEVVCQVGAGESFWINARTTHQATCAPQSVRNTLVTFAVQGEVERSQTVTATQVLPGDPLLCERELIVQKWIGPDRDLDALASSPLTGDEPADGWQIIAVCDGNEYVLLTGTAGDGTARIELPGDLEECVVSEVPQDGFEPIGYRLIDGQRNEAGKSVTGIRIDLTDQGDEPVLLMFFNKVEEPTPTPTMTQEPVEPETPTPSPTATPTAEPTKAPPGPGPKPPKTGSGQAANDSFGWLDYILVTSLVALGGLVVLRAVRRR